LSEVLAPPPPPPRQLPMLRQIVPVRLGMVMVLLADGIAKLKLDLLAPFVALRLVEALPWRLRFLVVLPMVKPLAGLLMVVRAVRLVMSPLAPLAAAPKLARALVALSAPVPPLPMLKPLVKDRLAKLGLDVVFRSWGKLKVNEPPVLSVTVTWLVVPVRPVTPVLVRLPLVKLRPVLTAMAPLAPPILVTVVLGRPVT